MSYPVLLFVATSRRAQMMQRDHDSHVLRVLPILSFAAYRASAILVEMPRPEELESSIAQAQFDEWMLWLPTRLAPGDGKRITLL